MEHILLVEDHAAFRKAFALVLAREADLEVVGQTGSFFEARRLMRMGKRFDIAVMDLGLPDGDGLELVRELREGNPDVRVLVLTIDLTPDRHAEAIRAGAHEVLGKHTPIQEILAAVKRLGHGPGGRGR